MPRPYFVPPLSPLHLCQFGILTGYLCTSTFILLFLISITIQRAVLGFSLFEQWDIQLPFRIWTTFCCKWSSDSPRQRACRPERKNIVQSLPDVPTYTGLIGILPPLSLLQSYRSSSHFLLESDFSPCLRRFATCF